MPARRTARVDRSRAKVRHAGRAPIHLPRDDGDLWGVATPPVRAVPDRPIDRPVRPADPIDQLIDRLESALPDVLAIVGDVLRDWFHALARATHRRHLCRGCGDTFRVRPPMCCSAFCADWPEDVDGDACRMEVVHVYHGRGQWSYLEGHHPVTLRYYAPDHPAWAGLYFEHSEH